MALNFNVDPYYDDFDQSKNFHRILFKPGYAVQARELTQSQTILQSQISKFADNIFSQNTPVTGGKVTTNLNCYYIKLNISYNDEPVVASDFLNKVITDSSGTVLAKVIATAEKTGTDTTAGDPPTLVVSYLSGVRFTDGMTVYDSSNVNLAATTIGSVGGSTCTGRSSTASISEGVFYIINGYSTSATQNEDGSYSKFSIGNFVSVQPKTIILSKYSNTPSYRIGLSITERVVDYIDDSSLLDPAVGASNYQAPGADRYQIVLTLTTLGLEIGNDDQFVELVRIKDGSIIKQVDSTVYSVIDDYFAKRDYETNGDYIVDEFKLTPSSNSVNSATYDLKIGKGVAYVQGYRIENQSDLTVINDRARETDSIDNNTIYIDHGSYFYTDNVKGFFDVTTMPSVDLHCVKSGSIVSTNTTTYNSTVVGTGYIRDISYVSNSSDSNTLTYVYKTHVVDINSKTLTSNSTGSSTSTTLAFYDTTGKFSGVANAYYGATVTITSGTSIGDKRKIVSYNGTTKVATVDSAFTVTPDTTTNFVITLDTKLVESVVKANATYVLKQTSEINSAFGKQNGIDSGDTVYENPNAPEMIFKMGYPYVATLTNPIYNSTKSFRTKAFTNIGGTPTLVLSIPSGNPLRFYGTGTLSGDTVKQNYIMIDNATNKIVDFSSSGNTVVVSSDKASVTFTSSVMSGKTVDVITNVSIPSANSTSYVLKIKNLVQGNTTSVSYAGPDGVIDSNTYIDLTKGQVYIKNAAIGSENSLYVSDVKKIIKIIDTGSTGTVPTTDMLTNSAYDVTNLFKLDNGQRDNMYDHAKVNLVAGAPKPKGNLLVIFDRYSHSGGDGYFSVMSYLSPLSSSPENYAEIPSYTSRNGTTYRLTDSVDFRPTRKPAVTTYTFEYTGDPTTDDTGTLIPNNLSEFIHNYSYYLGRNDLLVLTKDRNFQIIKGTPAVIPTLPSQPDGSLLLANMYHDAYTSYVPGENTGGTNNISINKVLHKRWAKRDISDLETRVNNLEYYTSLSLLEQNAQALQVSDVNGLNRFKNGILVDDFSSYLTADTTNADYAANINIRTKQLGPLQLINNFQLQNPVVMNSLGTVSNTNSYTISSLGGTATNIFTLPYTSANAVVQPLASSVVSLNPFAVAIYEGVMHLNPPMDNWVDTNQAPDILVIDPAIQVYQQTGGVNLTNSGDFATIPGTTKTTSSSSTISGSNWSQTTTTTNTYASQLQNVSTTLGYSPVNSTIGLNNGYLTNISILPYIRPQELIFKSRGLLVNSPVSVFFDGVNVNEYVRAPNTIELTNVSGTFKEGDVVGFYTSATGKFSPTARVISVYKYPNSTNCRLYVAKVTGIPNYSTSTSLQNATFDSNGSYVSSSASGTINGGVSALNSSGGVTGVGGSYTPVGGGSSSQIYKVSYPASWGTFLNQYGVWGDLDNTTTFSKSFTVAIPTAGDYTFMCSSTGSATVTANSITAVTSSSSTSVTTATKTLTAGNMTLAWSVTGSTSGVSGFALIIKDSTGSVVFNSTIPSNVTYDGVTQEVLMPKGGAWFTGVTKLKLDSQASDIENYYVGAKFTITSKYVYQYVNKTATYVPPPPARSGGGGRVICTHMTEIGEMDPADLAADLEFTKRLSPEVVLGYHAWAFGIVKHMKNSPKDSVTEATKWIARQRTEEIKYQLGLTDKPNYTGKYIRFVGEMFCWGLGTLINNLNVKNIRNKIEDEKNAAMEAMKQSSMAEIAKVYDEALK